MKEIFFVLGMHDAKILSGQILSWIEDTLNHYGLKLSPGSKKGQFSAI